MGARAQDNWIFQEKICRHRALMNLFDQRPKLSCGVFVAPNASVIGSVEIKDLSSVWYGAVIRADQSAQLRALHAFEQSRVLALLRHLAIDGTEAQEKSVDLTRSLQS